MLAATAQSSTAEPRVRVAERPIPLAALQALATRRSLAPAVISITTQSMIANKLCCSARASTQT
jgi:hypothetical protein